MTDGALTWFQISDLDETFTEGLIDTPTHMLPSPGCPYPGRDLEDRWSLDKVTDVGS